MPLQRSLFAPVYKGDLNPEEQEVAVYLDAEKSLTWWHRNVAHGTSMSIQGWRRGRIFPDFLFAVRAGQPTTARGKRLVAMEMKGEHLAGNTDTEYKQAMLRPDDPSVRDRPDPARRGA